MVCMKKGSYKAVLCFSKFVIKYPRINQNTLKNIKSILTEEYGYMTCGKRAKEFLLPIYFIPGIPILFQRRCQVYEEGNQKDEEKQKKFMRSEEHTSELQSRQYLVCRLLLEKKKKKY